MTNYEKEMNAMFDAKLVRPEVKKSSRLSMGSIEVDTDVLHMGNKNETFIPELRDQEEQTEHHYIYDKVDKIEPVKTELDVIGMNEVKKKEEKGLRYDNGKIRYDLMEPFAIQELAKVFTAGSRKYEDNNWLLGMKWSKMRASLGRHLAAYDKGEDFDYDPTCPDCVAGTCVIHTGLLHMAQVAWNALALVSYYKHRPEFDDRYKRPWRKIGLDIDEVICDFTTGWGKLHGITTSPEHWNYHRSMSAEFKKMKEDGKLDDFYMDLIPRVKPTDIPFEPHCYVTSRPVSTELTEKWLDKWGFPTSKVITVPVNGSKVQAMKDAGVEVFVDDRYENYEELNRNGILCYLLDAPHNQRYNVGYKRIKSLKELI